MTTAISDETLTAFLDGELAEAERVEVEAALARDPALAIRLEALEVPMGTLRNSFDALLTLAPEMPAMQAKSPRRRIGALGLVAALAGGLLIGGLWNQGTAPQPDWKTAIASYQALYVPETLAIAAPESDAASQRLAEMSAVVGRDLSAAQAAPGLSFRRAQVLGLEGAPLIQMAYVSDSEEPFAICVTRVDGDDYAPRSEDIAGLAAAHWVDDGYGYLVIGGSDLMFVEGIANALTGAI